MSKFYAKSTGGFYDDALHETMPVDAVPVTDAVYASLLSAQTTGLIIQPDVNGNPIASEPPPPTPPSILQQIAALEGQQTPRRIRDAIAGRDNGWLANLETQLTALRAQLH